MVIFPSILLTSASIVCHDQFERIARKLRPVTDPEHEKIRQGFMDAVDNYREQQVQQYFDEAICYYTGTSDPYTGIQKFCGKFSLEPGLSCMTMLDYVQFVAAHKQEIDHQLTRAGL